MQIHPCKCKSYNGGQCYNCLNGAHELCPTCHKKNSKQLGLKIVEITRKEKRRQIRKIDRIHKRLWEETQDIVAIAVNKSPLGLGITARLR